MNIQHVIIIQGTCNYNLITGDLSLNLTTPKYSGKKMLIPFLSRVKVNAQMLRFSFGGYIKLSFMSKISCGKRHWVAATIFRNLGHFQQQTT